MAEPDLSALTEQQRATYWTGSVVRNAKLLEVTLRTILRSLGRRHPADPLPGEPADFEALRLAVVSAVDGTLEPARALEIGDVLDEVGEVHLAGVALVESQWGVLEGSDAFQVLDLLPTDPEEHAPAVAVEDAVFEELRRRQVRAYLRLGGVEKVVRHASYDAPFDTDADRVRREAQLRGEFEVRADGAMVFPHAVGPVGLEPTTSGLKVRRSAN